jgi:hypothetical protein
MPAIYSAQHLRQEPYSPAPKQAALKEIKKRGPMSARAVANRRAIAANRETIYADLKRLWLLGLKGAEIAKELKVSESWVTDHAGRMGLPPRYKRRGM